MSHAIFAETNRFDLGENGLTYMAWKVESFNYFVQVTEFVVTLVVCGCFIPYMVLIFKDGEERWVFLSLSHTSD